MIDIRTAAFVAVGSELLRTGRVDTNSVRMAQLLLSDGVTFVEKRVVEDDESAIATAVAEMLGRVDLIVLSGGLGPTADDVTREGVARALGRGLRMDSEQLSVLERRYLSFGRRMPASAAKMADAIEGARLLRNPNGTAPGQLIDAGRSVVVLLPGVPSELEEIARLHLVGRLGGSAPRATRILHLGGVYESAVEARIRHLYDRFGRDTVTILAGRGIVHLVLVACDTERLEEMERAFSEVAGDDLFGVDDATLPAVVLASARAAGLRIATSESCTGGMIGAELTSVPGASEVYVGGVVAYADEVKRNLLGVPPATLAKHGAVSREVAEAMARGALALGAEAAVAVTGVAGPGGGSEDKPVGTVHVAAASPAGLVARAFRFPGAREQIRELSAHFALDLLRRHLGGGA